MENGKRKAERGKEGEPRGEGIRGWKMEWVVVGVTDTVRED